MSENKLKDLGFMIHGSALCEILCCVAPTEDKYGVVQLVLPEILNTVCATLKAIDQVIVAKRPKSLLLSGYTGGEGHVY